MLFGRVDIGINALGATHKRGRHIGQIYIVKRRLNQPAHTAIGKIGI